MLEDLKSMKKFIKFYFFLQIVLLSFNAFSYQDLNVLKTEVIGRAVILDNNIDKARRLALEDALYLSSLKGGAFVDGFSSVSQNTILNDQSIIKSESQILDFKILEENKRNDHYEIKILAVIGSKNNSFECKQKPINISIFKSKVILHHSLPSYIIRSMYEWNNFFIDKISNDNQILLKNYDNYDLNKIIESSNNVEFDYSSNVDGIPLIENGDLLVAPVFKVLPVNSYKKAENAYNIAKYSIQLNFFKGPDYKFFKTFLIDKEFQHRYPSNFQLISALTSKTKEEVNTDIYSGILNGINEMTKTFDCLPIEANLKLMNNSLYIDLGKKHGLRNRQIGIVKKNYQESFKSNLDTTVLFISEIKSNRSKLVPLNDKVEISDLDRMKIQFIE